MAQPEYESIACWSCGYVLDGLPAGVCPECNQAFDPAMPDSFRRVFRDPTWLCTTTPLQAPLLEDILRHNDIDVMVERHSALFGADTSVLWVRQSDHARAENVLADHGPVDADGLVTEALAAQPEDADADAADDVAPLTVHARFVTYSVVALAVCTLIAVISPRGRVLVIGIVFLLWVMAVNRSSSNGDTPESPPGT